MSRTEAARISVDDVRDAYRRWAPVYDFIFGPLTFAGRRQAVRHANRGKGRVLEAGVGTGISLAGYDDHLRIVGVDLSSDMLRRARERVERRGLTHVEAIREMDVAALDFADNYFDTVVAMYLITVVPDPVRVLSELARVCRPGGEVVLVNHFMADRGPRAAIERGLARYAPDLGWHPDFRLETVLGHPDLEVVERRALAPFGIFSMLRLRKTGSDETAGGGRA